MNDAGEREKVDAYRCLDDMRHLGKINLIWTLGIAHTIFVTVWRVGRLLECFHIAIISHFEIDTNSTVEGCLRIVDVQVSNTNLYNLGQDVISLLVSTDSNLDR